MNDKMDRQNTIVVSIVVLLSFLAVVASITFAVQKDREKTALYNTQVIQCIQTNADPLACEKVLVH